MPTQVRRAVLDDGAAIAAVHVRSWQVAYRGLLSDDVLDGLSVQAREASWRKVLEGEFGPAPIWVALEEGVVVGFCAVATPSRDDDDGDGVAQVGAIYVRPDVWGTGVGRALMEAALEHLRAGNWHTLTLWVLAKNERARGFYARFGFEPDGAEETHELMGQTEVRLRASLAD